MTTSLSPNFTLEELTHTDTGVSNVPNVFEREKLRLVANTLLQPIRDRFGPIFVSSGFRCAAVQEAIKVTQNAPVAKSKSQHELGEAVDFIPQEADLEEVFEWAKTNLNYGQLIIENHNGKKWIHISLPREGKKNMMAMRFENNTYTMA